MILLYRISHGTYSSQQNFPSAVTLSEPPVDVPRRMESTLFSKEHYIELRAQVAFLSREQLDLVILGSVMATINMASSQACKETEDQMTYMHHGHKKLTASWKS